MKGIGIGIGIILITVSVIMMVATALTNPEVSERIQARKAQRAKQALIQELKKAESMGVDIHALFKEADQLKED